MFVVFGMVVFLLFKSKLYASLALTGYIAVFYKKKGKLECINLLILVFVLCISHSYSPNRNVYKGKVEKIHDYGFTLRGFAYSIYLSGDYTVGLSDKVAVEGKLIKEDFPSFNRYIGKMDNAEIVKHREVNNLRKIIYNRYPEHFTLLFDASNDHIINSLGLQVMGIFAIYCLLYRRFFGDLRFEKTFILSLSFIFGRSFIWWRLLLKSLKVSTNHQIIILLILFPNALTSPSFIYAYSLYLIGKFTDEFKELDSSLLFAHLSLYFFHEWHAFMLFIYPVLKYLSGMYAILILLSCFIAPFNYLLLVFQSFGEQLVSSSLYQRFLLRGNLHFLTFFMLLLVKSKKDHLIMFLIMLLLMIYPPLARITYIDVGQGDSTLVSLPFNTSHYLIDTGRVYAYGNVKRILKQHGVKSLDYLVLTHDDLDHVENKDGLVKEFKPRHVMEKKHDSIDFMHSHLQHYEFGEENEDSIILSFKLHGLGYILLGDAHKKQEEILVKENPDFHIDILKLGHHGSDTSTSNELLKIAQPKFAIISSKPSNYNHPRPEVLRRLFNHQVLPIETSKEGSITVFSSPLIQYIKTSKGSFAIIDKGD